MFGYIQVNQDDLMPEEKERYNAVYCGLCHSIGDAHGIWARLALTYDLTFLALLLSSLYEPEEQTGECSCVAHPIRKHKYARNEYTDYAADMTVALTYYKCLDDWNDDHNLARRGYAALLSKEYKKVKQKWPLQCGQIETSLAQITELERARSTQPDAAANCFGELMGALFVYREDHWKERLWRFGAGLGRYIYLCDAAVDFDEDLKSGSYNPLTELSVRPENLKPILMTILGESSQIFEALPLIQDVNLLRNILYSGLWIKYNLKMKEKAENRVE